MFKNKKVKTSWDAVNKPIKNKKPKKNFWVYKHINKVNSENNFLEEIIKFFILITLSISINNRRLKNKIKRKQIVNLTYDKLSTPGFSFIPAGLGLYLFFSLIPISIIIMSFFSIDEVWYNVLKKDILEKIVPGFGGLIIEFDVSSILKSTTTLFFLITLIWFSSKGLMKFVDSQSNIYNHTINTNYLIRRARAILLVIFISLFASVSFMTFIPLIIWLKSVLNPGSLEYEITFYFVTTIFLIIWFYIGLAILYRFSPLYKIKFKQITPGILTTLIPTVVFVMSFGYLASFLDYSKFGSIGTFLYLVIFVQIFSYFLYAGLIINSSYYNIYYSERVASKKWIISMKIINWFDSLKRRNR